MNREQVHIIEMYSYVSKTVISEEI